MSSLYIDRKDTELKLSGIWEYTYHNLHLNFLLPKTDALIKLIFRFIFNKKVLFLYLTINYLKFSILFSNLFNSK